MSSFYGKAIVNGKTIKVEASGDDLMVRQAMVTFGQQLGEAIAKGKLKSVEGEVRVVEKKQRRRPARQASR
jgi:hypothetical protein